MKNLNLLFLIHFGKCYYVKHFRKLYKQWFFKSVLQRRFESNACSGLYLPFFLLHFLFHYMTRLCTHLADLAFQICDMVAVARFLNLTLVVPELDRASFWADPRYILDLKTSDLSLS